MLVGTTVYTIGYSGFAEINAFVDKLKKAGIDALCDVRSIPRSSYFEQYNDYNLKTLLPKEGIAYLPFAKEFGARQEDRRYYTEGEDSYLDFEKFVQSELFRSGVERVEHGLEIGRVPCFLCAEKNPSDCHRAVMVARAFRDAGYDVVHLTPGGQKTQHDVDIELVHLLKGKSFNEDQSSIFDTGFELKQDAPALLDEVTVNAAYRKQNEKIGFRFQLNLMLMACIINSWLLSFLPAK